MPLGAATKALIAGAAALAGVGVVVAVVSASSSTPSPQSPATLGGGPYTLKSGERYRVTLTSPTAVAFSAQVSWLPIVTAAMAALSGTAFIVRSASVSAGQLVYVFDVVGATVTATAAQLASISLPATVSKVEDLGPSPVGAARPPPSSTPAVPPTAPPGMVNLVSGAGYNLAGPANPNWPAGSVIGSVVNSLQAGGQWHGVNVTVSSDGQSFSGTGTYVGPSGQYPLPTGWTITPALVQVVGGLVTHLPTLPPATIPPTVAPPPPPPSPPGGAPVAPGVNLVTGTSYTIVGPADPTQPAGSQTSSIEQSLMAGGQWQGVQATVLGSGFTAIGTYVGPTGPQTFPQGWAVVPTTALPAATAAWTAQTTEIPGPSYVRGTVTTAVYQIVDGNAAVGTPGDRERFSAYLAAPPSVQNGMFSGADSGRPFVWGPNDELPVDWPADDNAGAGFRFEFYWPWSFPLKVSTLIAGIGMPTGLVSIWSGQGTGQAPATATSGLQWWQTTSLLTMDHVRADLDPGDVDTLAAAMGSDPAIAQAADPCAKLRAIVNSANFASIVGAQGVLVWCGSDLLPPDWPTSTQLLGPTDLATQYHLEFRNLSNSPIQTPNLPIPLAAWVAHGVGA